MNKETMEKYLKKIEVLDGYIKAMTEQASAIKNRLCKGYIEYKIEEAKNERDVYVSLLKVLVNDDTDDE